MNKLPVHHFSEINPTSGLVSDGPALLYGILLVSSTSEARATFYDFETQIFSVNAPAHIIDDIGTLAGTTVFLDFSQLGPIYFPTNLSAIFEGSGNGTGCWAWWDGVVPAA